MSDKMTQRRAAFRRVPGALWISLSLAFVSLITTMTYYHASYLLLPCTAWDDDAPKVIIGSDTLPCVPLLTKMIEQQSGLDGVAKDAWLLTVHSLTYASRDAWIRSLNPLIVKDRDVLSGLLQKHACPTSQASRVAVVTVTNGISPNIQEWCMHYLLLGVKKLIVYDDSKHDSPEQSSFRRAMVPFVEAGVMVLEDASVYKHEHWGHKEEAIHMHAFQKYGSQFDWIGFYGSDEFVVVHSPKCICDFLAEYKDYAGLVVQWHRYTAAGVPFHNSSRTHFEQYHYTMADEKAHIKSFVQPNLTKHFHQHHGIYMKPWHAVNSLRQRVDGPFNNCSLSQEEAFSTIELRHFFIGDWRFALFEKVCGLNPQRQQYIEERAGEILESISNIESTQSFPLFPNHNRLTRALYNREPLPT